MSLIDECTANDLAADAAYDREWFDAHEFDDIDLARPDFDDEGRDDEGEARPMSVSNDIRLLEQAERALHRVSDWFSALDTVSIDGRNLDDLGELIHAVDEARHEAESTRP